MSLLDGALLVLAAAAAFDLAVSTAVAGRLFPDLTRRRSDTPHHHGRPGASALAATTGDPSALDTGATNAGIADRAARRQGDRNSADEDPGTVAVRSPLAWVLVGAVRVYQAAWAGRNSGVCRFEPSCSSYALGAVRTFGGVRGGGLALYRLARCQPLSSGGFDPVPTRRARATGTCTTRPSGRQTSADTTAGAERSLGTRA